MASTLSREDVMRLPTRTVNGIASTVGGVTTSEETGEVHFRGSRANDVAYYVDGMRLRNVNAVSKGSIDNVTVLTSGIPANYGDVTGGVIRIETKSYTQGKQIEPRNRKSEKYVEPKPLPPAKNYDAFLPIYENDFLSPLIHPNSTFGIDIDQASWSYLKNQLVNHLPVARDAVKMEEMINSFDFEHHEQATNELVNVSIERLACTWNKEHELVKVHLKAQDLPKDLPRKHHNFVFLIDVSGSMSSSDRLPLLVQGLKEFVKSLQASDRVAIVTYAGTSGVVLEPTLCNEKSIILNALDKLTSGGSTNGIGGIAGLISGTTSNDRPLSRSLTLLSLPIRIGLSVPS
jgi:Ca-activated chloride channel family protein